MIEKISVEEAVALWVSTFDNKVAFFDVELYDFLYQLRQTRTFQNRQVKGFRTDSNMKRKFLESSLYLIENGLVRRGDRKYFTIGRDYPSELDVICSLYDFGYISYLSALNFYNLTNKKAKNFDFTVPTRSRWKELQSSRSSAKHTNDEKLENQSFETPYPSERIKIRNGYINVHSRTHNYEYVKTAKTIRIISIGNLFLEMIRHPDLCGGFPHVLGIYESQASNFLEEIIDSAEKYGTAIDKSRIGFIISSHIGINDKRVTEWKNNSVSRGGSRKMIPNDTYSENYSEEWCISLNHPVFA